MNQGAADSIDDIISIVKNHYQPLRYRTAPNKAQVKSNSVSRVNRADIRYLTFKNYSGKIIDQVPDMGYYFKSAGQAIKLVKGILEENGFKETQDKNWSLFWSSCSIKNEVYSNLSPYQKVCHFPKSYEMTRKDLMHRNISKMQITHGFINFNFIPKTYILPAEMSYFLEEHEKYKNQALYICKPHASSQGKGIFITDKVQDILNKMSVNISYVVSHYIDKPLLINEFKFDLRIYVAMTCINPLRIYVYQDGLTRFATEPYQKSNNKYVHLTNYAINKENPNFIANQDPSLDHVGSKWSLLALREYMKLNKIPEQQIFDRIDDIIIKTILAVETQIFSACEMSVPYRTNCFSLFGFDILLDSSYKPWLLEVNFSPSLNIDAPLDLKIKGEMLSDLFTLIGIVPLDQRFTKKDPSILKETEDEEKRSRGWRRVFPSENSHKYTKYFETDRPLNAMLRQQLKF